MSWFKVSDGLAFHRKVLAAGNEALGAWVRAGAWSSAPDNLTDGYIPPEVVRSLAPARVWARARRAGLTDPPAGGRPGEQIHDFAVYNPPASEKKDEREATRKRVAAWREKRRGNADGNGACNAVTNGAVTGGVQGPHARASPVPSRPVPSAPPEQAAAGARPEVPIGLEGGSPGPDLVALAASLRDEGNPFGASVCERVASGRMPTPNQLARLRAIRDERAAVRLEVPAAPAPPKPAGARAPTRAELAAMLRTGQGMSPSAGPDAPPSRTYVYGPPPDGPAVAPQGPQDAPAEYYPVAALLGGIGRR